MIVDPENFSSITISIYLKDGRKFENRNISNTVADTSVVACWDGDNIRVFPMDAVREYVLHFDNN